MNERWIEIRKGADFAKIGETFSIDPVIARLIRNRDVTEMDEIRSYLYGGTEGLHDPRKMRDMEKAVSIITDKIKQGKQIRIIGDYDIDGVSATYILLKGLRRVGACASVKIPDRMKDGYGINEHLILRAKEDGVDTILTCDNGIAALDAIAYAKKEGMTVVVTDHHDIPFEETDGERHYLKSEADAIVNPHQPDCAYPYKMLCGAAIAWKFIQVLYETCGIPMEEADEFLENAAFATVGDVVDLTGENRLIVRLGLEKLHHTKSPGMRALILQNNLRPEEVKSYHIGFVLGPCINASGRLDTAKRSLELLLAEDEKTASVYASDLIALNESRKDMTHQGVEAACEKIGADGIDRQKVMIIYLPDCHESLAGIIAGRIRERYNHPVFVLTDAEDGVKGSGRSIEAYSMYEEMTKCKDLFTKFGGHPMAAGLSLPKENIPEFVRRMNENCTLTEADFAPVVNIDIAMPLCYITERLIGQLDLLEPFGKENTKPVFAVRNILVHSARVVGKNANVLRLSLVMEDGRWMQAVHFGDPEDFFSYVLEKYGEQETERLKAGRGSKAAMSFVYYPKINEYNGERSIQIVVQKYR